MLPLLLPLAALSTLLPPIDAQEDWENRLNASSPAAARAELVALGKDGVPILLEVLEDGKSGAAFQAALAFTELGEHGKKGVPSLLSELADDALSPRARSHYALALAGSNGSAKKVVPALLDLLDDKTDAMVTRAVQVSLAALGKDAAPITLKVFAKEDDGVRLFRLGEVLVSHGGEGAKGVRMLGKWVADPKSGYRGLLSVNALRAIGKKGAKTLEQAMRKRPMNAGAILPLGSATTWPKIIMFLRGQVDLKKVPTTNLSLPSEFTDLLGDDYITLAEILVSLSGHLGQETGRLGAKWLAGEFSDRKSFDAEIKKIQRSDGLIRALLER